MVSIQTKREDFSSRDPVQDVKYLAERITREEERAQLRKERASKTINPKMIAKLLPADIQVRPSELLHLACICKVVCG